MRFVLHLVVARGAGDDARREPHLDLAAVAVGAPELHRRGRVHARRVRRRVTGDAARALAIGVGLALLAEILVSGPGSPGCIWAARGARARRPRLRRHHPGRLTRRPQPAEQDTPDDEGKAEHEQ